MDRLKGKIAVITGASEGIGKAAALLFAREGASVVILARRKNKLDEIVAEIKEFGGNALAVPGDVNQEKDCVNVFEQAIKTYGKIDILVNNAGMADSHIATVRASNEHWEKIIAMNQNSVFMFCREALRYMEKTGSGSIVNVSSIAGVYANAGIAYSASKYAVIGMTKNIALQYAGTGIRCNSVCPGPTETAMLAAAMNGKDCDTEFAEICGRHNDPEVGISQPEDQANAILFFASDESKCVTGQVIVVDRGKFM